jgi:EAL domain-containing protein (putative c-di-GMP-specific phosphodiesterase class I)
VGVYTVEQLERLRREGCREIQGFRFSGARSARDAGALIATMHRKGVAAA